MNIASILIYITNEAEHSAAMQRMEYFAEQTRNGGFAALSDEEQEEFGILAEAIEQFEKEHFPLPTKAEILAQHVVVA